MSPILHVTCFIFTLETSVNDTLFSLSTWLDAGPRGDMKTSTPKWSTGEKEDSFSRRNNDNYILL